MTLHSRSPVYEDPLESRAQCLEIFGFLPFGFGGVVCGHARLSYPFGKRVSSHARLVAPNAVFAFAKVARRIRRAH